MKRKKTKLRPKQKNNERKWHRFSLFSFSQPHSWRWSSFCYDVAPKRIGKKFAMKKKRKIKSTKVIICFVFYRQFFWCMAAASWKRFDSFSPHLGPFRFLFHTPTFEIRLVSLKILSPSFWKRIYSFCECLLLFWAILYIACWLLTALCVCADDGRAPHQQMGSIQFLSVVFLQHFIYCVNVWVQIYHPNGKRHHQFIFSFRFFFCANELVPFE